jgi:hypothetical protein
LDFWESNKGLRVASINALVLKHFTIGLLLELRQQVKYEQTKMFDEMMEVVEKNK